MRLLAASCLALLTALPSPAHANVAAWQIRERLITAGTWNFTATALDASGQAKCRETWIFRDNRTSSIVSGDQQTEHSWNIEVSRDGLVWLVVTTLSASAGADCLGNVADPADLPRPQQRIALQFFDEGHSRTAALTCRAPDAVRGPDGKPVHVWRPGACWGVIESAAIPAENRIDPSQWRIVVPNDAAGL